MEIHRSRAVLQRTFTKKAVFWISSLWWLRWTLDRSQSFCMAATDTPGAQYHRQTCNSAGDRALAVWTTAGEPELTQCSMSTSVRAKMQNQWIYRKTSEFLLKKITLLKSLNECCPHCNCPISGAIASLAMVLGIWGVHSSHTKRLGAVWCPSEPPQRRNPKKQIFL